MDTGPPSGEYSTSQEQYFSSEGKNQYDNYAEQSLKTMYNSDAYYQRDYTEAGKPELYQSSENMHPEYGRFYGREPSNSYDGPVSRDGRDPGRTSYNERDIYYEQLSPPSDQPEQPYPKHYSSYGYTEKNNFDAPSSQCKNDDAYGFTSKYSKREVFEYANYAVGGEPVSNSPRQSLESSFRH